MFSTCCTGSYHTICLSDDGRVFTMGNNLEGQLGFLNKGNSLRITKCPCQIETLPPVKRIACGKDFSVCLDTNGNIWTFGNDVKGQLGRNKGKKATGPEKLIGIEMKVVNITCGLHHTLFTTIDNTLWSFGANEFGQLCLDNVGGFKKTPQKSFHTNIIEISGGSKYSLIQNDNGDIFLYGKDANGEICEFPKSLPLPPSICSFCSGLDHSLFLDRNGDVYSFGNNINGQLGFGHSHKVKDVNQIPYIPKIVSIACGDGFSMLIDEEQLFWIFGFQDTDNPGLDRVRNMSNGFGCFCLVQFESGDIWCTGENFYGQLGLGHNHSPIRNPSQVLPERYSHIFGSNSRSSAKSARK